MIEQNPEISTFASLDNLYAFHVRSGEAQALIVRAALRHGAKVDKDISEELHNVLLRWGPVAAYVLASRKDVCERVQVGEETLTESIPDPSVEVPTVEVTKTVPVYEWQCSPLLASAGES
jgi:hypothetical protein